MSGETKWWRCPRCEKVRPSLPGMTAECYDCAESDGVWIDREPVVVLPVAEYERLTRPVTQYCPVCEANAGVLERLRKALRDAVNSFWQESHPGRPALKAMVYKETVDEWRAVLGEVEK